MPAGVRVLPRENSGDDTLRSHSRGQKTALQDRVPTRTWVYLIVSDEAPAYFQASNGCSRRRGDPSDSPWTGCHLRRRRRGGWLPTLCPSCFEGLKPSARPALASRAGQRRPYLIAGRIWV